MDDPYAELARIKARLAELEAMAAEGPRPTLESSLGDHYAPSIAPAPVDRKTRDLRNAAHGFVPDLQAEAALAARSADPQRFDADYRAMHGDSLALALYDQQRAAAIATGAWKPTTDEGDAA